MKISLVINVDTRPQNNTFGGANLLGCVNEDFLTHGIDNKIKFFNGYELEVIVHVDVHNPLSVPILTYLNDRCDVLIIRNHTHEHLFNDHNYIRALSMATGDIICHVDADTCMFSDSKQSVDEYIKYLDNYSVVSYPHWFSPNPDHNENYDYFWSSTRWFICRKDFLDLQEIEKCLHDNEYFYSTYPASIRNPWFEHALGLIAKYKGDGVFYPPMNNDVLIFSWGSYKTGLIEQLNNMSYAELMNWQANHPIVFPNDIYA